MDGDVRHFGALGLRTWFFVKPLLDDGHQVRLITLGAEDVTDPRQSDAALLEKSFEGFQYKEFDNSNFESIRRQLEVEVNSFEPDAMIGVNTVSAWTLSKLPVIVPLWADLNGYEMTEKQGQAAMTGNDDVLLESWRKETSVVRRADQFSTVSGTQRNALLGELAMLGRLNQHTFHFPFVNHIPNAFHPLFTEPLLENSAEVFRGKKVPRDAFVLLMSGGYNYWMDPNFLFDFLEGVMAVAPSVHFVSTGGGVKNYNTQTYDTFCSKVRDSEFRERYHLLGWVPGSELPAIYQESDLGLNIDEPNYETFFGARNRLNNMMAAGLPVLTTLGSEISQEIAKTNCGVTCPPRDVPALVKGVLDMLHSPEQRRKLAERSRRFAVETYSSEKVTEPLRDWVQNPRLAPDNAVKLEQCPELKDLSNHSLNYLQSIAQVSHTHDLIGLHQAKIDLDAIRSKPWFPLIKSMLKTK